MPELGDVEGFRRTARAFEGATIETVSVFDDGVLRNSSASEFIRCVRGKQIGVATRLGKWLMVPIGGPTLLFHFGMTGSLVRGDGGAPHPYDRVAFDTDLGDLRFRDRRKLRGVYLARTGDEVARILGDTGPDALGISVGEFRARLERSRAPIKTALTDQRRVSGIGNFLSDEILWRAGIDPCTPAITLTGEQWTRLHGASAVVLRGVARAGRTPRGPRWLTGARWKTPAVCPACGSELHRAAIGGRTSVWCPICQPPRTVASD